MLKVLTAERHGSPQFETCTERCAGANDRPLKRLTEQ